MNYHRARRLEAAADEVVRAGCLTVIRRRPTMTSINDRLDACAARVDALSFRFERFSKRRADAVGRPPNKFVIKAPWRDHPSVYWRANSREAYPFGGKDGATRFATREKAQEAISKHQIKQAQVEELSEQDLNHILELWGESRWKQKNLTKGLTSSGFLKR